MTIRDSPWIFLIREIKAFISEEVCFTSKGLMTISPKGRRMVTMLLPLETSIPTAFIKNHLNNNRLSNVENSFTYCHSIYCGVTRTYWKNSSTCINRTLQVRSWSTDYNTDAKSKNLSVWPIASYSLAVMATRWYRDIG